VFHIAIFGELELFGGTKPTKAPCGDGTDYQQTSILKTVSPNHARWDIDLLDAQQWLQRLTFYSYCDEQLYSVQPASHCQVVQPFRLALFLLIALTIITSKHMVYHCVGFETKVLLKFIKMRATPFLSFSCWNNFFYDCKCLRQGCSGAGTRGTGVPTPFSRFSFKWVRSCFKIAIFYAFPHLFFLALHSWFKRTVEQRRLHENHIGWLLFTLLAVQTDKSELKVTHANRSTALPRFKNVIFPQ